MFGCFGNFTGCTTVTVYNGFTDTVSVSISEQSISVPPFRALQLRLPPGKKQMVSTRINNRLVETFAAKTSAGFGKYVYNVGQAMPLVEWTQVYGNASERPDRLLGTPRWFSTSAEVLFKDPPKSVESKNGGATRLVLSALDKLTPDTLLSYIKKESEQQALIRRHVIWDAPQSAFLAFWIGLATDTDIVALLKERLSHYPYDIASLLIIIHEYAPDRAAYDAICAEYTALAEQQPDNSNVHYISICCMNNEEQKDLAFIQGKKQWPRNAWFHFAAGYTYIEQGNWLDADRAFTSAINLHDGFKETLAITLLRLKRLQGNASKSIQHKLSKNSHTLSRLLRLESGEELGNTPYRFYSLLNKGDIAAAFTAAQEMKNGQERCIRLLAASEDAPAEIVNEAVQLDSTQGIDQSTVW
ncbi:MAG: hypothetical protein D3923_17595, partial [Candidatus Electrothrix sp. AR3]|nr:hypothetical protein [Candidatus Electrothrix sp. AR3]